MAVHHPTIWRMFLTLLVVLLSIAEAHAGTLQVRTDPSGASVFVGTRSVGRSPIEVNDLPAGPTAVTVSLAGYTTLTRAVKITDGQTVELHVELAPLPAETGAIVVIAPPGGHLKTTSRDLGDLGSSPTTLQGLPVGRVEFIWTHPEYYDLRQEAIVLHGGIVELKLEPRARPGRVLVISNPPDAQVRLQGRYRGITPIALDVPAGEAHIEVTHLGYRRELLQMDVYPTKELVTTVDLSAAVPADTVCPEDTRLIPAGTFAMGEAGYDRVIGPRHEVSLDAFCMDRREASWARWARCVEEGACPAVQVPRGLDRADQPVVGVDWAEAEAFCRWDGGRLPTEAEWERAARGTTARLYPWGSTPPTCRHAWYAACTSESRSAPVGSASLGATPEGIEDLAGNVFEWVGDWMSEDYYGLSPDTNPRGPSSGQFKVIRGGGFSSQPPALVGSARQAYTPDSRLANLGFRCVKQP